MANTDESVITATLVPRTLATSVLPAYLGFPYTLVGETMIYGWMDRLAPEYHGGRWQLVRLSNGGFFMYPIMAGPVRVEVTTNEYAGRMSPEGAGIVACLFALCDMATRGDERIVELFHLLRDYAAQHADAIQIFRAID